MPQDLIRRRPDIRVAERRVAAQSAQIGVAVSDLYPSLGLTGSIGPVVSTATEGQDFLDLFNVAQRRVHARRVRALEPVQLGTHP